MNFKLNNDRNVAVDLHSEWQPMTTCPLGAKVQLLGMGGVAVYGVWNGRDDFWVGWYPIPRRPLNVNLH